MAAGLYLGLRNRWPGRPTLIMDHERLVYSRFGRERALRWDEVERIGDGRYLAQEMMFVPVSGGKPIVVSSQMVTADGEYFLGLIEEYWTPPKKRRKRSR
jgi:hypothetical protein